MSTAPSPAGNRGPAHPAGRRGHAPHHRTRGFTLTELMVVVAVAVLLATLALPAYQDHVRKARRAEAHGLLLEAANRQARHFADNEVFVGDLSLLGYPSDPAPSEGGHYELSATVTASGYLLTATAVDAQASDSECAALTLASDGAQGAMGGGDCW